MGPGVAKTLASRVPRSPMEATQATQPQRYHNGGRSSCSSLRQPWPEGLESIAGGVQLAMVVPLSDGDWNNEHTTNQGVNIGAIFGQTHIMLVS